MKVNTNILKSSWAFRKFRVALKIVNKSLKSMFYVYINLILKGHGVERNTKNGIFSEYRYLVIK